MHLAERDFELLRQIAAAQADGPLRLEDLASKLEVSPSALVRRAKALQDAGWIRRRQEATPRGRAVFYTPVPRISVEWLTPHGQAIAWSVEGQFELDFPLTTQLADGPARETARRFLWELRRREVLDAEYHRDGNVFEDGPGLALIVYGSSARGDTREDSDLDVVVVLGEFHAADPAGRKEAVLDAAAKVSLEAPRTIQVHAITERGLAKLPQEIRRALRRDGLIVYDAIHHDSVWQLVYGGRGP